ncbi:MAG: hypothetical protein WD572_07145 [Gammaproteobacteria bacterium]
MIFFVGLLLTLAWIWLIVIAFKSDAIVWGVVMILFFPAAYLFGLLNWDKASKPFIMLIVATALMFMVPAEQLAQFQ